MISIHAPQWGATLAEFGDAGRGLDFNPRTPVGCDRTTRDTQAGYPLISIHAPQWGATDSTFQCSGLTGDFNPRTPVGCDDERCQRLEYVAISIHAPQWGATVGADVRVGAGAISIHAPQWGATGCRSIGMVRW